MDVFEFEREGSCSVCNKNLEHEAGIYAICPSLGCEAVAHLTCLSKHFLNNEPDVILPVSGTCPRCKTELRWVDVAKELSLRMRGQKEVEKLLRAKRARKEEITPSQPVDSDLEHHEDQDDELEEDIYDEIKRLQEFNPTGAKVDIGDRWHTLDDSDESDASSEVCTASKPKSREKSNASDSSKAGTMKTVIEDSDWDDALVLD